MLARDRGRGFVLSGPGGSGRGGVLPDGGGIEASHSEGGG